MRGVAAYLIGRGLLAPFTVQLATEPSLPEPPQLRTECAGGGSAACAWKRIPPIGRPPLEGGRQRGIQKRD